MHIAIRCQNRKTPYAGRRSRFILRGVTLLAITVSLVSCSASSTPKVTLRTQASSSLPAVPSSIHGTSAVPPARYGASMVYDQRLGEMVMWGGGLASSVPTSSATWLFNGTGWTRANLAVNPPPSYAQLMTYDPHLGDVVLLDNINPQVTETWLFNGIWTRVDTHFNIPMDPARISFIVYDPALNMDVLVTEDYSAAKPIIHAWLFNGHAYTRDTTFPVMNANFAQSLLIGMSYDPAMNTLVLLTASSGESIHALMRVQTLMLSGHTWRQVNYLNGPMVSQLLGASGLNSTVFDTKLQCLVLFGSYSSLSTIGNGSGAGRKLPYTWCFKGNSWTDLHPSISPQPRTGVAMAYDPKLGDVVLFGGLAISNLPIGHQTPQAYNDTWLFNGHTWTKVVY